MLELEKDLKVRTKTAKKTGSSQRWWSIRRTCGLGLKISKCLSLCALLNECTVGYQCGLGGSPRGWLGQVLTFLLLRLHIRPIPHRARCWAAERGPNDFSCPSPRLFHPDPRTSPETCIPNLKQQQTRMSV